MSRFTLDERRMEEWIKAGEEDPNPFGWNPNLFTRGKFGDENKIGCADWMLREAQDASVITCDMRGAAVRMAQETQSEDPDAGPVGYSYGVVFASSTDPGAMRLLGSIQPGAALMGEEDFIPFMDVVRTTLRDAVTSANKLLDDMSVFSSTRTR